MIASGVYSYAVVYKILFAKEHGQFVEVTFTHYILIEVSYEGNLHLHISRC